MDIDKIEQATKWLQEQALKEKFAEISIKLIIHEGIIKRIEKGIVEKEQ